MQEIFPDFIVKRSSDLLIRGNAFYAIWDEESGLWSTDELTVARLVDKDLYSFADQLVGDGPKSILTMSSFSSKSWMQYKTFIKNMPNSDIFLDQKLTFSNTPVKKEDYVSKRLPYPLEKGSCEAFEQIISTLYDPDERTKLEWAIGSIVSGDSRDIQKFVVLYGEAGTGKSTMLNIIQKLFPGYYTTFDAKSLTSANNAFSTEVFKSNPLVAIQHDGDLSHIEDNSKLNSIVSHEEMTVNEKFKAQYTMRANCFLFMGTNKPVMITDAKSGLIRRLIDIAPSGRKLPPKMYHTLMGRIDFELGAIAQHCLDIYNKMGGADAYASYKPMSMIFQTDAFFNFVESSYDEFAKEDGVSLTRAYDIYNTYCDRYLPGYHKLARHKFREELRNYFDHFDDITRIDGKQVRSWYSGFLKEKFKQEKHDIPEKPAQRLLMDKTESLFDKIFSDCPAQYASKKEAPIKAWADVTTKLSDISTDKLHYVKVPENLVVIDFDIRNSDGDKDMSLNLEAAAKWPPTYAEFSKSGCGVHLHYFYDSDVSKLERSYADGIEVKVFTGGSALRRKVTLCNDIPIATINSGLPVKEVETTIDQKVIRSERKLRELILRNLNKEIHPGTKPSIDFIFQILEDAYSSGLKYDVSDMRQRIFVFAMNSTHQSDYCMKKVGQMKFKSETASDSLDISEEPLVFFDLEVFPNLVLVNWKYEGEGKPVVRLINPTPQDVEALMKMKLVGFNCRRYDNHILYAIYLGYSVEQVYAVSQRIIADDKSAMFGEAYNMSYTDVYDFSSKKQSLKKFEIELGIHHQELGLPWDQPVPKEMWNKVAEYCDNDVLATEAVFKARQADWTARKILADLAGMSVNDTTNSLTTRIIFGQDRNPQRQFNYRFLGGPIEDGAAYTIPDGADPNFSMFDGNKPIFPGYSFDMGKSVYRGEEVGEGGYVYAEPGIYYNIALLDISSMHPSSIVAEELFGPEYTKRFKDILDARIAIKHKDFAKARTMLDGKLSRYLDDESASADLAQALKIAINSVYGLTSAKFDNPFRDIRNKDNIVAKRGALFMVNLKHEVQRRGYTVAHIKTDSIKIPNATPEIIEFVMNYGKAYGYSFEHEATYDRMCLVNDAVYIAKYNGGKHDGEWTAVGAQFQQPYVFKTLFSHEPIGYSDLCETKTVTSALYLDMDEHLPDVSEQEKELDKLKRKVKDGTAKEEDIQSEVDRLVSDISKGHDYRFVGKAGLFSPIKPGCGGGRLVREKDGRYYAVGGTKGYRWLESEYVMLMGKQNDVDRGYYDELAKEAVNTINQYGSFDDFVASDPPKPLFDIPPWTTPCGERKYNTCLECPKCVDGHCSIGFDSSKDITEGGTASDKT